MYLHHGRWYLVAVAISLSWACGGEGGGTSPDTRPPSVVLTTPAAGTVQGAVSLTASATDDRGVVGVRFRLDDADLAGEDTEAPYALEWNSVEAGNGPHTLTAVARDEAGNTATSAPLSVTVANPPAATTGTLQVSVATSGSDLDGDGYTLDVAGGAPRTLTANGSLTLPELAPGTVAITLAGVADNCTVVGYAGRSTTITAGATATVAYAVRCAALANPSEPILWRTIQQIGKTGYTLYTIRSDGTAKTPLSLTDHHDPEWSQDRTKIAFSTNRDGNSEIYVMDADGSNERRLTTIAGHQVEPTWSPDGTRIAYKDEETGDIWVMNADGTGRVNLTNGAGGGSPAWAPSADLIAFARGSSTWVMKPDGSEAHAVTVGGPPKWSPNGSKLLVRRNAGGKGAYWLVDADGSHETFLVEGFDLYANGASWAPNGRQIVYYSSAGNQANLWTINTDGTDARNLTNGIDQVNDQPSWFR